MPINKTKYTLKGLNRWRSKRGRGKAPLSYKQTKAVSTIARRAVRRVSEKKSYRTAVDNQTFDNTTGYVLHLTSISQGDGASTRDGNSILLRSVQSRFSLYSADATQVIRVIYFQWFPESTPTVTDILSNTYTGDVNLVNSPYELHARSQFRILADRTYALEGSSNELAIDRIMVKKFARRMVTFDTTSTTAPINGLYMLVVSDSGAVSHPYIHVVNQVNYSDP